MGTRRCSTRRCPMTLRERLGLKLAAIIASFISVVALGCASMNQKCTYYPDGVLESYRLRSTILGTGNTEVVTTDCTALAYTTEETGLSDNGKDALGTIAEGVAKGVVGNPL